MYTSGAASSKSCLVYIDSFFFNFDNLFFRAMKYDEENLHRCFFRDECLFLTFAKIDLFKITANFNFLASKLVMFLRQKVQIVGENNVETKKHFALFYAHIFKSRLRHRRKVQYFISIELLT